MIYGLSISGQHHVLLRQHLLPGDGKEAVAIAICGRLRHGETTNFLVNELFLIPYDECLVRKPEIVKWSTLAMMPALEKASNKSLAILKIHSHPTGYRAFSATDDSSDRELFESVFGWADNDLPHASAVMLPSGEIFARVFDAGLHSTPVERVRVSGDDIKTWFHKEEIKQNEEFALRTSQTFGEGTTSKLKRLKVGVVGCSGTGSPTIEQLVRLGIGHIVLVDPDIVEKKNLNRIFNSTIDDAELGTPKVDMLKQAIDRIGLGTKVTAYKSNIYNDLDVLRDLATCDAIFGCMDTIDGRHLLNQLSTFYLIPYFDLGVKLTSDGKGGIDQIMGTVHYIKPGGSSLRTRGLFTEEDLRAASMLRTNKSFYEEQKKSGYIVDVKVESPAVISINTQVSSMAVNEFLARIHPFRYDPNEDFAINRISITDGYLMHEPDGVPDEYLRKFIGRGDMSPFLNMSEL